MKEALHYSRDNEKKVKCHLCPHNCIISLGKQGMCNVRKNLDGKLYSLVYGKAVASNIDPVEKKPLYHFLPGSKALSIGTVGCNLKCFHCQNWELSQAEADESQSANLSPEEIVALARKNNCESIAYTYNEPTIFFEYVIETSKLARQSGIKNILVTNGYINQDPLKELCKYVDAVNVDLKSFDNGFYINVCKATLLPVLETLKTLHKKSILTEVTNLIIPTKNDNLEMIKSMCIWLKDNLGDTIMHFSRFYPHYQLNLIPPTRPDVLIKAKEIAMKYHSFVYIGNLEIGDANNTSCPVCGKLLIKRGLFSSDKNNIKDSKCDCGKRIKGIWK